MHWSLDWFGLSSMLSFYKAKNYMTLPYFSYIVPIQVWNVCCALTSEDCIVKANSLCVCISPFALMIIVQEKWKIEDIFLESNEEERGNISRVTAKNFFYYTEECISGNVYSVKHCEESANIWHVWPNKIFKGLHVFICLFRLTSFDVFAVEFIKYFLFIRCLLSMIL